MVVEIELIVGFITTWAAVCGVIFWFIVENHKRSGVERKPGETVRAGAIASAIVLLVLLVIFSLAHVVTAGGTSSSSGGQPGGASSPSPESSSVPSPTLIPSPSPAPSPTFTPTPTATTKPGHYYEQVGPYGSDTFTDYSNAGGMKGAHIDSLHTVEVSCRLTGWRAPSGDNWWYRLPTDPWYGNYYAPADNFYNLPGSHTGPVTQGPAVDTDVPLC